MSRERPRNREWRKRNRERSGSIPKTVAPITKLAVTDGILTVRPHCPFRLAERRGSGLPAGSFWPPPSPRQPAGWGKRVGNSAVAFLVGAAVFLAASTHMPGGSQVAVGS